MTTALEVLQSVAEERQRQDARWGEQNHIPEAYLTILVEEVGEVGRAILDYRAASGVGQKELAENHIRHELIQVAAVAVAMIECLNRKRWKQP